MKIFEELKIPDWPTLEEEVLSWWKTHAIFEKSVNERQESPRFTFYEGPPSANGKPGIHHVMARTVKDIFCRYKTMKGFRVERRAGWDTHGLPVELEVEKSLGIRKDDIGVKISVEEYNNKCREAVMRYTDEWNRLTERMGFWLDLSRPYITYETQYIETVWYLLKQLYDKQLLYKGYTIQPYSPAAGTGLSTHELNQPGCYKTVKDHSVTALFFLEEQSRIHLAASLGLTSPLPIAAAAWTTTPWTLPSNTGLGVNADLLYDIAALHNPYTGNLQGVILAHDARHRYFNDEDQTDWATLSRQEWKKDNRSWCLLGQILGSDLENLRYQQLLPYARPEKGDNFRIVTADFVTTEEGTGIVHLAPSFGADDFKTARQKNLGALTLVDKQGRFTEEVTDMAGEYVKPAFYSPEELQAEARKQGRDKYLSVDERIIKRLKQEGKALHAAIYEHNYPHCWRTDKPIIYYPLDSWFIRTTAVREALIRNNHLINWKPESTGTGRFGNWLENLVDWNLSRSRFWGIPLPIWRTEDGSEEVCIGSLEELSQKLEDSVKAGLMKENPLKLREGESLEEYYKRIDLHKPYADQWILVSRQGKPMYREPDLIDVWFDSGAMPYAQWHWPFENEEPFRASFPADFIAEGVDQTRGWFFTLHAIATMIFDSPAFRNVVATGLVLDKNGNKMSKRLGNAVDPMALASRTGFDAIRWYMMSHAHPWENLRFDPEGPAEILRGFMGTVHNTYLFMAVYANVDQYIPQLFSAQRPYEGINDFDRWILQRLNHTIKIVDEALSDYETLPACRAIEQFVNEELSNWYVRLNRRRFWKSETGPDKTEAYDTLFTCLHSVCRLMAPIAPFYSEKLFHLLQGFGNTSLQSVHLAAFPEVVPLEYKEQLDHEMLMARRITSLALSIRKKQKIRVRQPLSRLIVPVFSEEEKRILEKITPLLKAEINIKEVVAATDDGGWIRKSVRPNFRSLGPRLGSKLKHAAEAIKSLTDREIRELEATGSITLNFNGEALTLSTDDVEIIASDLEGFQSAGDGTITVALDVTLTAELLKEGLARDMVNRIQNLRKELNLKVNDRVMLEADGTGLAREALHEYSGYICAEVLADKLDIVNCDRFDHEFEIGDGEKFYLNLKKV
jgi:isoleucyl-tRNA synthetase